MDKNKDYTGQVFLLASVVIVILLGVSRIHGFRVGGVKIKKINILSDIVRDEYAPEPDEGDLYFDTTFLAEGRAVEAEQQTEQAAEAFRTEQVLVAAAEPTVPSGEERPLPPSSDSASMTAEPVPAASEDSLRTGPEAPAERERRPETPADWVPIEDFGGEVPAMDRFYGALFDMPEDRPVRIAVLGDSFIEGDILTADLREGLQDIYGGRGVGFVPFSSSVAMLRGTVKHTASGWRTVSVKDKRQAPEDLQDKFFLSGDLCLPSEGASVRMEGVAFRKHIDTAGALRLIFINREQTVLHVTVDDTLTRTFAPESGEQVQQIDIRGPFRSVAAKIERPEGFIGYGIELADRSGVIVDNYSIRGNSGLALFGTNFGVNSQIGALLGGYDLIVLQYGLNVMSADVMRYDAYADAFARVVKYMKRCFHGASILVMGVGDRSTQREGRFVTMPAVHGMIAAQRRAAEEAGVAFWNTFEAMGGEGAMVRLVEKNWAAKDYTHIGYRGGKFVAGKLVDALREGAADKAEAERKKRQPEIPPFGMMPDSLSFE